VRALRVEADALRLWGDAAAAAEAPRAKKRFRLPLARA